jgi:hypothetical protein
MGRRPDAVGLLLNNDMHGIGLEDTYRSLEGGILHRYTEGKGTSWRGLRPVPCESIEFLRNSLARGRVGSVINAYHKAIG